MSKALGDNVYGWINNRKAAAACVECLAKKKYRLTYKAKVVEKISKLSSVEAQKLLVGLVEDEPLVGINILKM